MLKRPLSPWMNELYPVNERGDNPKGDSMRYRERRRCKTCGHHISAHEYTPGVLGPSRCVVPGCTCSLFIRPAKYERIPSGKIPKQI